MAIFDDASGLQVEIVGAQLRQGARGDTLLFVQLARGGQLLYDGAPVSIRQIFSDTWGEIAGALDRLLGQDWGIGLNAVECPYSAMPAQGRAA